MPTANKSASRSLQGRSAFGGSVRLDRFAARSLYPASVRAKRGGCGGV